MHRARRPAGVRRLLPCLVVLLVGLPACGFDAHTLQPHTAAMGVNADVAEDSILKVRNLLLVSRAPGRAFVSAGLILERPDALVDVSGVAILAGWTHGAALPATVVNPVELAPNDLPLGQLKHPRATTHNPTAAATRRFASLRQLLHPAWPRRPNCHQPAMIGLLS